MHRRGMRACASFNGNRSCSYLDTPPFRERLILSCWKG